jgi:uncharacterized membrane protein YidH (DUF202 family)
MPRARKALLLPAVVAAAQIVFGVLVFADQTCDTGGDCNDEIVAWFVGVPLIVVGGLVLVLAVIGWRRVSGPMALACCLVSAAFVLLLSGVVGAGGIAATVVIVAAAIGLAWSGLWAARAPDAS